ncbi:BRO-N domain-containing protein, partial [Paenibacillus dendritiformis]
MNQLQVFNFTGTDIRVVTKDGQPWWVAKDVAEVLGFDSAYRVIRLLDEDEKDAHNMVTPGGPQS